MNLTDTHASEASFSPQPDPIQLQTKSPKRTASEAELHLDPLQPAKKVKRRATQACQSCRVRKVRCNVAKHGVPCTNCRLDEVECILGESRRKRRKTADEVPAGNIDQENIFLAALVPSDVFNGSRRTGQQTAASPEDLPLPHGLTSHTAAPPSALPAYIKPLPARFGHDDITYLQNKGALSIPGQELRNELLRCHAQYMYPLMPLLDWHMFVRIIDQNDGVHTVSLLLFQAVMFSGIATADMRLLKAAGYSTRREARRAFFTKTRLLYDLDYEDDSIALIQALLLMTYWKENPDGQKETHHWIEIAVSLSHKLGLHRDPEESAVLEPWQQKLHKRIWWSAYMRDCQIALSTRKPSGIKDVDFDVPMLQPTDFELETASNGLCCSSTDGEAVLDIEKQRQLAIMCIEKAKLSLCVSHILSVHYGDTSSKGSTRTATMLFVDSYEFGQDQLQASANALRDWKERLPEAAQYVTPTVHDTNASNVSLVINRAVLHMFYHAAATALYRPQLLPSTRMLQRGVRRNVLDASLKAVRMAATEITAIASTLHNLNLTRYLPSTSITLLLPAIVYHLLNVLSLEDSIRRKSLQDYCKCMQIMGALRDMYAAVDYSTAFLQAAIQRTEIGPMALQRDEDRKSRNSVASVHGLTGAGRDYSSRGLQDARPGLRVLPTDSSSESGHSRLAPADHVMDLTAPMIVSADNPSSPDSYRKQQVEESIYNRRNTVFDAVDTANGTSPGNITLRHGATMIENTNDFELNSDSTTNLGADWNMFSVEEDVFGGIQGEGGMQEHGAGSTFDTDWMMGMGTLGFMLAGEEQQSAMI